MDRIDVLRAVAILLVVLSHTLAQVTSSLPHAWVLGVAGVLLFFVISGFCIHVSASRLAEKCAGFPDFLSAFLWRRFWRIYPPYLVALALFYLLSRRTGGAPPADPWLHLALGQNLRADTFFALNPSFWSISMEWHFYLLYPLLSLGWRRLGPRRTLALTGGISAVAAFLPLWLPGLQFPLSTFSLLLHWMLGVWIAEAWLHRRSCPVLERIWLPCLLVGALPALLPSAPAAWFIVLALGWAGLLSRVLQSRAPLGRTERWLVPIGLSSYSLYLWHQPLIGRVLYWLGRLGYPQGPGWTPLGAFVIAIPLLIAGSWVSYRVLEKPSIAIGHRAGKRR